VWERRAMRCIESAARPQSHGAHAVWAARFSGDGSLCGNGGRWGASKAQPVHRAMARMRYGRPASAGTVPCVGTAGDGVHRKRSPSTEPWCACGVGGLLQRGGFLVRERRAMGCIESAARSQSRGATGAWTARFSGEGSSCGNGGRWGASEAQPVHRAVVRMQHGRPASAGIVPCAGTAGDGVHRKRSPFTEPWCDCGMDGPLQWGGLLVWERRAMGCIESTARPQSRGAQRYGRPASAGMVPRAGAAGDGVHRKRSPSTKPWRDCGMDGPLQRGRFLVWEWRAMGCIESAARPQSRGVHAVWAACFSGEGSSCGNGGRWGAPKAQPVHKAVVRSGMDGLLQRGGSLVWERRAMGCIESTARPQSRGATAAWTACFSGDGSLCGNGGRWGASKAQPVHRAVVRLRHGRPASAGTVPCAGTAGDKVARLRSSVR